MRQSVVLGRSTEVVPSPCDLFTFDSSVMTTGAPANPALSIVALVLRQADHIEQQ